MAQRLTYVPSPNHFVSKYTIDEPQEEKMDWGAFKVVQVRIEESASRLKRKRPLISVTSSKRNQPKMPVFHYQEPRSLLWDTLRKVVDNQEAYKRREFQREEPEKQLCTNGAELCLPTPTNCPFDPASEQLLFNNTNFTFEMNSEELIDNEA